MKKMGRPELPLEKRKMVTLTLRLTAEERDLVDHAASEAGMKLSAWARKTLVQKAHRGVR
jgi:uncharacterized protein (DUF1778 family)